MKILITTDWYKPTINGVVTSVENLYHGLTDMGHEVRIATLSDSRRSRREGNVFYYGSIGVGKVYPGARLEIPHNTELTGELIRWHPDVVHSQCEFSTYFLAKKIAHCCNIPLVHTYHTVYEDYTHYFFHNKWLGKNAAIRFSEIAVNHTDAVIVPSEKMRNILSGYRIDTPIHVIPSGIQMDHMDLALEKNSGNHVAAETPLGKQNTSAAATAQYSSTDFTIASRPGGGTITVSHSCFAADALTSVYADRVASSSRACSAANEYSHAVKSIPSSTSSPVAFRARIREQYGIRVDEFLLLYLGRLAKEKNVEELLVLLAATKDKSQKLLLVGDGPARVDLERLAWKLGVRNRVIFTGMVSPKETAAYYHAGDVFVCASQSETQGLTYFEAMAAGLPILCKKDLCLTDTIMQGENGFLYETSEEFEQLVCRLRDNPKLREKIGGAAQRTVAANFSIPVFAASCSSLYEQCIQERKKNAAICFGSNEYTEILEIC